jgi:hypothetical protein
MVVVVVARTGRGRRWVDGEEGVRKKAWVKVDGRRRRRKQGRKEEKKEEVVIVAKYSGKLCLCCVCICK